jgi:hypothetical protein
MDSGAWRYGQADEPPPNGGPTPNLWADESTGGWSRTPGPEDTGWQRIGGWSQSNSGPANPPPAPALPQYPASSINPGGTFGKAGTLPPSYTQPGQYGGAVVPVSPPAASHGRTGLDTWSRPDSGPRRRFTEDDDLVSRPSRRGPFGEEPAYGPVLGYTAAWYGIPALLYLVWLVTLDDDRQGIVGRQFLTSLPWLLAAVVLSLAVAAMLRWAIVGWRAITLSFAAAVIGAGVTTIAHSLTL